MQITQLCSSGSVGIVEYTRHLATLLQSRSLACNVVCVGGKNTLQGITNNKLVDHHVSLLSGYDGVLHIQYDTLLFKGVYGDDYDEFENFIKFYKRVKHQFERVVITMHGQVYFNKTGNKLTDIGVWLLRRYYMNKVVPILNECDVLVHSQSHDQLLRNYGVKSPQQWLLPLIKNVETNPPPKINKIKFVIPGKLSSWKDWQQSVDVAAHFPGSSITVSRGDKHLFMLAENYCKQLDVKCVPIDWSPDTDLYLDQLSEFDVSLLNYHHDVPYSGCLNSSLQQGLIAVCNATPSFKQIQQEHDCIVVADTAEQQHDGLSELLQSNTQLRKIDHHRRNYVEYTQQMFNRLADVYTGRVAAQLKTLPVCDRDLNCSAVTISSRTINKVFRAHEEFCRLLPDVVDDLGPVIAHAEYQMKYKTSVWDNWTGILHGPFDDDKVLLNRTLNTLSLIDRSLLAKCKQLYVTNTKLLELARDWVDCDMKLLDLHKYINKNREQKFNIDNYINSRSITIAGWFNSNVQSIYNIDSNISKYILNQQSDPLSSDILYNTKQYYTDNDVTVTDRLDSDSVLLIDPIVDDVVDNYILYMLRTGTPGLVRRNSTTQEYLGADYPLMFDDIKQAGKLLTDENVVKAVQYLS